MPTATCHCRSDRSANGTRPVGQGRAAPPEAAARPAFSRPSGRRRCPSPRRPSRSRAQRRARDRSPTPSSPSPASSALVEHISAQIGSLPSAIRLRPYFWNSAVGVVLFRAAGAEGALVHLAARAEIAGLRILRRAEGAGVEAIAAADAQVLGVQDHAVVGLVEAVHRADRHAGRVRAVHAGDRDRPLARLAVIDGDDPPAVDAPGHLVLVLAGGDAGVAFDAALGVAEELRSCHSSVSSLRRRDLAERGLGLLHLRHGVVAIGLRRVRCFAQHIGIGPLGILAPVRSSPCQ